MSIVQGLSRKSHRICGGTLGNPRGIYTNMAPKPVAISLLECLGQTNFRASGSVRRHCPLPFLLLPLSLVFFVCSVVLSPSLCSPSPPSPQASLSSISLSPSLSLSLSPCLLPVHAPLQKKGTLIRTPLLSHFLALSLCLCVSLSLFLCLSVSLFLSLSRSLSLSLSVCVFLCLFL